MKEIRILEQSAEGYPLKIKDIPDSMLHPDVNTAFNFGISVQFENDNIKISILEIDFQLDFIPKSVLIEYSKIYKVKYKVVNEELMFNKTNYNDKVIPPLARLILQTLHTLMEQFISLCFKQSSEFQMSAMIDPPNIDTTEFEKMVKEKLNNFYC